MPQSIVCPHCDYRHSNGTKFCFNCRKPLTQRNDAKPFRAEYRFRRDFEQRQFDDYETAKEWVCVKLEKLGAMRERFASVKIFRANVCVWELPQPKPENLAQPFVDFNLPTAR